ncbi:hypothetical protein BT69DRAFT_1335370 [Atractiella rhizophila]|nr:hypothetical protein BT69DRAFT_1335370 [Atractiella rhizophila]
MQHAEQWVSRLNSSPKRLYVLGLTFSRLNGSRHSRPHLERLFNTFPNIVHVGFEQSTPSKIFCDRLRATLEIMVEKKLRVRSIMLSNFFLFRLDLEEVLGSFEHLEELQIRNLALGDVWKQKRWLYLPIASETSRELYDFLPNSPLLSKIRSLHLSGDLLISYLPYQFSSIGRDLTHLSLVLNETSPLLQIGLHNLASTFRTLTHFHLSLYEELHDPEDGYRLMNERKIATLMDGLETCWKEARTLQMFSFASYHIDLDMILNLPASVQVVELHPWDGLPHGLFTKRYMRITDLSNPPNPTVYTIIVEDYLEVLKKRERSFEGLKKLRISHEIIKVEQDSGTPGHVTDEDEAITRITGWCDDNGIELEVHPLERELRSLRTEVPFGLFDTIR